MIVELLNTGSELLLGRVLNTHQQWIGRRLADLGWPCSRQTSVPDTGPAIRDAVLECLRRADWVITTGGLGPTSDDITRDLIAGLLDRPLVLHPPTLETIRGYFTARRRPMPASVEVQARVPEGALVLPNRNGTAPGLALRIEPGRFRPEGSWLVMLPGPPRELKPMFDELVVPLMRQQAPDGIPHVCLTLRTCGLGESWVEERLTPILPPLLARGLTVGYCARTGEVDVRLVATGPEAHAVVHDAETATRELLGDHIFGENDELLEEIVIRLAIRGGARIAVAESCTGGCVAHRLTNVPGASRTFWGGWITYDNEAKIRELQVPPAILAAHGAVSEPCARAMAEGALAKSEATHAVAITGIAGPSGGTEDKPVGTVFIALAVRSQPTRVLRMIHPFDRETFKYVTSQQALDMLRRSLLKESPVPPPGG